MVFNEVIEKDNNYPWTKKFYIKKNLFKENKKIKIGYINNDLKIYKDATNEIKKFYNQILEILNKRYSCKIFKINIKSISPYMRKPIISHYLIM